MDSEPAAEQLLGRILPLPFRVAILLVLGVWLWASNLNVLQHRFGIDVPGLIKYPSSSSSGSDKSTYRLATILSIPLVATLLLFFIFPTAWLPFTYLLFIAIAFAVPTEHLSSRGRFRFLTTLQRVSIGGLATDAEGRFGDILVADVLTSYAKPLADLYVVLCLLFNGKGVLGHPDRSCGGRLVVPFILAVPFLIRLRQCLIEAIRARAQGKTGYQHLANALKYASAFPGIIISTMKRESHPSRMWVAEAGLSQIWVIAIMTNSFYSFYWDVAKDWDLTLFSSARERNAPGQPWALRRQRIFQPEYIYYAAIAIDLVLRCTWSLKLSIHLYHFGEFEGGIFIIEILEILRRWMWVFLRVETEWLRQRSAVAMDMLPLVDQHNKLGDD
ncbi:hypothetical protein AMS68_005960 [Peltaster fructicola]|uniref:EXS domain-containing protein n=1 Tax=Peltaster fructicola TaxID=286661 RepID=A0A6H0Y0A6_9PEZI|nr:hypothetical protein AMS68_005960 [Peltaster fructicola]